MAFSTEQAQYDQPLGWTQAVDATHVFMPGAGASKPELLRERSFNRLANITWRVRRSNGVAIGLPFELA